MTRRIVLSVVLAASVSLQSVSASQTPASQVPAAIASVDAALAAQFVAATETERHALIKTHPEILGSAFRVFLADAGRNRRGAGDLAASERNYEALLFIGRAYTQQMAEIIGLLGLGSVEGTRSSWAKARMYLEQGLAASTVAKYSPGEQQALNNLGTVQRNLGDLFGAMDSQLRSLDMARQGGDPLAIARVLNNLGITYNDLGLGARAIEAYSESLALKQQNDAPLQEVVNTVSNMGGVYAEQGDYPLAIDYYHRALALIENTTLRDQITSVYNNLGQVYSSTHQSALARQYLERALALAERIEDPGRMSTALYILGNLDREEGKLAESEATQRRVLALRESTGDLLAIVESLTELANLLEFRGRAAEGVSFGERAVALAAESHLDNQLWKSQVTIGHIHATLGHDADASRYYEQAIQTIERLRVQAAGGQRAQQGYFTERVSPYYGLAEIDVRSGRPLDALAHVDQARARALVDIIAAGKMPGAKLTVAQREDNRNVTRAMQDAAVALDAELHAEKPDPKTIAELESNVSRTRIAREAFLAGLYAQHPDLRFARGNTPDLTRERLLSVLTPGTAIVTFVLDGSTAWAYVATRNAAGPVVETHRLAMTAEQLTTLAERFAKQIATRDLSFAANARTLYDALFGPVDARITSATHVILVPDGPLWQVPFQALQTPRGRYLIEERAVSYTPSIAALVSLEDRRRSRATPAPFLVALGDPAVAASAPSEAGISAQRGTTVARLPEAAREVRSLGRLYGASRSSVLVDKDATETALRQLVSRASVLHVATHGILENGNPMYSRLLLAPSGKTDASDHTADGRIEAWEVLDMDIHANIAVLSACETARGNTGFGEGMVGLSWSLFASGASTTVVSQWEVDSASTTNLMIAFHQRLLAATSKTTSAPDALRQAAMSLLKSPASRHPFYWAGFIAVGAK